MGKWQLNWVPEAVTYGHLEVRMTADGLVSIISKNLYKRGQRPNLYNCKSMQAPTTKVV